MLAVLAQAAEVFTKPNVDYHALAPELVLVRSSCSHWSTPGSSSVPGP
ncbi:MAG: hypothetical protein R2716_13485 [Microthrixaceae bacterium]